GSLTSKGTSTDDEPLLPCGMRSVSSPTQDVMSEPLVIHARRTSDASRRVLVRRQPLLVLTAVLGLAALAVPDPAGAGCPEVLAFLAGVAAPDVVCVQSSDLTTATPATTPPNNSLPGLPPFAFTPQTDRDVISPAPPDRTPITKVVPGIQVQGRFADDPTG